MRTVDQASFVQHYRTADRLMLFVLWGLFIISLGLSTLHQTLAWAFVVGLPLALVPSILIFFLSGRFFTRVVVAASMMAFVALHIHQAAGATETHFGVFVLLAFLLFYRDWKVILVGAIVIALHHLSFNYLQEWGYGAFCFTETGLEKVIVHAVYVVFESLVLSYLSVLLHRDAMLALELSRRVKDLADNEHGTIDLSSRNELSQSYAGKILEQLIGKLQSAVGTVQKSARTITDTANLLTANSTELATHTQMQSQVLADITSSMRHMTDAVQNNTDSASKADALAVSASSVAERGGMVVSKVVSTMGSISESSRKIADIISVIDGIAFQTNILALNAAVEAARAGEQGRGFAVVASEVRNLAQRSAGAAKEIKDLIENSVSKVEAGSSLVNEAGATMEEIVSSVKRVNDIMAEMMAASKEQSIGIKQVNEAIGQMERVTQKNAALVDETSGSASSMHTQASDLAEVVSVFKIEAST